jgi:hypothetical protein
MGTYSICVEKLVERLQSQLATGKVLAGFKFDPFPSDQQDGASDLPRVRLFLPSITEQFKPRSFTRAVLVVKLIVSTNRVSGVQALVTAVEKVVDAVEMKADGTIDPLLEGTLRKPFSWSQSNAFAESVSSNAELTFNLTPKKIPLRGKRRL